MTATQAFCRAARAAAIMATGLSLLAFAVAARLLALAPVLALELAAG